MPARIWRTPPPPRLIPAEQQFRRTSPHWLARVLFLIDECAELNATANRRGLSWDATAAVVRMWHERRRELYRLAGI